MANYKDLLEKNFIRQIKYNNIEIYHKMGFKGKGITILNAEGASDHREMTSKVIKDYAPEATLLESSISIKSCSNKIDYANVTIKNETLRLEDAIDKYKIKVITRSYAGSSSNAVLNYYKEIQERKGVIFFCSAGNDGSDGITGIWSKNNTAISVGAVKIKEDGKIEKYSYSAIGEELDFVSFLARGQGTSAASPGLASFTVLLLQRYGDFSQAECVEILKSLCVDGDKGYDNYFGWGLPILPLTDKLEKLERIRGDDMEFKDVEKDRWSKEAIYHCVKEGLLVGFEDGTFKPTEFVTREQFATILTRILDKINQ